MLGRRHFCTASTVSSLFVQILRLISLISSVRVQLQLLRIVIRAEIARSSTGAIFLGG
jgi:hypothetical protein